MVWVCGLPRRFLGFYLVLEALTAQEEGGPSTRECSARGSLPLWALGPTEDTDVTSAWGGGTGVPQRCSGCPSAENRGPHFLPRYLMLQTFCTLSGVLPVVTAAHPEVATARSFQAPPTAGRQLHSRGHVPLWPPLRPHRASLSLALKPYSTEKATRNGPLDCSTSPPNPRWWKGS